MVNGGRYVREAYEGTSALLPEVPVCGHSDQTEARPGLEPHTHPDAFEICLIDRGDVEWWVTDHVFTLRAGQVFVTQPGERHGGIGSTVHPCALYWIQVAADLTSVGLEGFVTDLTKLPVRTMDAGADLRRSIRRVVHEHRHRRQHSAVAARAALHTALVALVREASEVRTPRLSRPVHDAMRWMTAHLGEPVRVADAAAAAGLSEVRLQARFRRELDCAVGEYWNRLRVHEAKRLLRDTSTPVTEIAHRLGFASSQYFATFFRQHVGLPPSTYRTVESVPSM